MQMLCRHQLARVQQLHSQPCALLQQVEKEARDKKQAEADKRKQEQQAKKDAEAKVSVRQTVQSTVFVAG